MMMIVMMVMMMTKVHPPPLPGCSCGSTSPCSKRCKSVGSIPLILSSLRPKLQKLTKYFYFGKVTADLIRNIYDHRIFTGNKILFLQQNCNVYYSKLVAVVTILQHCVFQCPK